MDHIRISLNGNALHILQAGNFDLFALNALLKEQEYLKQLCGNVKFAWLEL